MSISRVSSNASTPQGRVIEAAALIEDMEKLHYTDRAIADRAGFDSTRPSHIKRAARELEDCAWPSPHTLGPRDLQEQMDVYVSHNLVAKLRALHRELHMERFPLRGLDACHGPSAKLDHSVWGHINYVLAQRLARVGGQADPAAVPLLPDGIAAVLAQLGTRELGMFLIAFNNARSTDQKTLAHELDMMAHEFTHLAQRYRDEAQRLRADSNSSTTPTPPESAF